MKVLCMKAPINNIRFAHDIFIVNNANQLFLFVRVTNVESLITIKHQYYRCTHTQTRQYNFRLKYIRDFLK